MSEYAGLNLRLPRKEFEALRKASQNALRHPRDHARYLLREALGLAGSESQEKENPTGKGSEAAASGVHSNLVHAQ